MEATTKKRGRPSVFDKTCKDGGAFKDTMRRMYPGYESERALTNELYFIEGLSIAEETCNAHSVFFTPGGKCRGKGILEQIGRMHIQNDFDIESCKWALNIAVDAFSKGATVKNIESYIRHGRNTNEW